MDTNTLSFETVDALDPSDKLIHELQGIIDKLGSDAEFHATNDRFLAACKSLDRAWDLQRATYDQSCHTGRCRPSIIRDTLLAIGSKVNETTPAKERTAKMLARIDAEVAAGTRDLLSAESDRFLFRESGPYSSAERKDLRPKPLHYKLVEWLTKQAKADLRRARNRVRTKEPLLIETRFGTCTLTCEEHNNGNSYELVTVDKGQKVESGGAGTVTKALVETYLKRPETPASEQAASC